MRYSDNVPHTVLDRCPLCDCSASSPYRGADIVRCRECGFVFLRDRMTVEAMEQYYRHTYSVDELTAALTVRVPPSREAGGSHEYEPARRADIFQLALGGLGVASGVGIRLLDIGCGWGGMLRYARACGAVVEGVELTGPNVAFARDVLHLTIHDRPLTSLTLAARSFDAVTMTHTLEHLPDPRETIAEIHRILRPGGVFVGAVPNIDSICSAARGDDWPWLDRDWHYSHFSPATLGPLIAQGGFGIDRIYTLAGDYGEAEPLTFLRQKCSSEREAREELARAHALGRGEEIRWVARKEC